MRARRDALQRAVQIQLRPLSLIRYAHETAPSAPPGHSKGREKELRLLLAADDLLPDPVLNAA